MLTKNILLFVIYVVIFSTLVIFTILPDEIKTVQRTIDFNTIVLANKIQIYNLIADVEKYPLIFPDIFFDVKILNIKDNSITTEETAKEIGIEKTFQIQHDLTPFESHEITILDGDAKDTKIVIWFNEIDENTTKISVQLNLQLKGILIPLGILPDDNIEHAFNTLLTGFVEYLKIEKISNT